MGKITSFACAGIMRMRRHAVDLQSEPHDALAGRNGRGAGYNRGAGMATCGLDGCGDGVSCARGVDCDAGGPDDLALLRGSLRAYVRLFFPSAVLHAAPG